MLILFLKGLVLGFLVAIPVGPIGLLCIQRTIARGLRSGFVSGLGAATADGFYGSVAAFSLTAISGFIIHNQQAFRLIGGIFLLYMAIQLFRVSPGIAQSVNRSRSGDASDYFSTLILTLTNPTTIFAFATLFAGFGFTYHGYAPSIVLVIGVFAGSTAWWFFLCSGVSYMKSKSMAVSLVAINKVAAVLAISYALYMLVNASKIYFFDS
jgi:threonine/homoserine/homoserine lactone efflux protein